MLKKLILLFILLLPAILLSQESRHGGEGTKIKNQIPIQAQYSDHFRIKNVNFNKSTHPHGKGELLEVVFELHNRYDDPADLYIFVIATFEKRQKTRTSFEMPILKKDRIRSFVPYPFDIDNFKYPATDSKGNQVKDEDGKAVTKFRKYPRDPKKGINPYTGKMYKLKDKLYIRTTHLSNYRNNYYYFNEVAILIFNKKGEPQFKRQYKLVGFRR